MHDEFQGGRVNSEAGLVTGSPIIFTYRVSNPLVCESVNI
jgi:hypothetical protein